jgi:hypothetical protein
MGQQSDCNEKKQSATINLTIQQTDKKMPCRFSLNTTERTYYFSAATWKEMEVVGARL